MAGSTPASISADLAAAAAGRSARPISPGREAWRRFRRHRLAVVGLAVLAIIIAGVLFGTFLWRIPMSAIDYAESLSSPDITHPFGTDDLGHDLLARMIFGGRISLAVGLAAMLVAVGVGVLVGAVSGMAAGRIDAFLMWLTDLFLALPQLPLLLLIIYLFRNTLQRLLGAEGGIFLIVVVVIGGLRWMSIARLVRAQIFSLREKEFVEAARALGASRLREVVHHILPNTLGPIIVAATIEVANAIIAESTLSFLGLGFPPDIPTWGRLLYDGQNYLDLAPQWAMFPGMAIFLTVLAINFVGDGLRDALDPRRIL
jgi:peptide/nickel transport system permease protein